MTDTTTLDEAPESEELPELVESETARERTAPAEDTPLKTRVLLPLLVPLLSIAIVGGVGAQHLAACSSPATRTPRWR